MGNRWVIFIKECSQNSQKPVLASSCLSASPHGTIRLLPETDCHEIFIFEKFSKLLQEISSLNNTVRRIAGSLNEGIYRV